MSKIYKYELAIELEQTLNLPINIKFLHLDIQEYEDRTYVIPQREQRLCFWAEVDNIEETYPAHFSIRGTGSSPPEKGRHLGTVQCGSYVWHVYTDSLIGF